MKKLIILLTITILCFSGCTKEIVFIKEPKFPLHTIEKPVDRSFPFKDVKPEYAEAYKAWKEEMYATINNLNTQIDMYLRFKTNEKE